MIERLKESRLAYIVLSVLLATVFWLYVRGVTDPVQATTLRHVRVEVTGSNVLTKQGLTVAELSADHVDLKIEAPASVLENLNRYRQEISVVVDVSKCLEGENKLTYQPNFPNTFFNTDKVIVQDRSPETLTITVEKLYTKSFPIEFKLVGKVADGYQTGTPAVHPEMVQVSGSVEQVGQVDKVVAILENENLTERFAGDLPLTLLDAKGEPLKGLDVHMDTDSAYVVLPVNVVKDIPLTVNIIPGGGATEADITCKIEPSTITVAGEEAAIKDLPELSLGSVDLSKVIGTSTLTFPVTLDPSLENVSGVSTVTVTVTVNGLATRTFDVDNIVVSTDSKEYKVSSTTQVRTIQVRGKKEDLAAIDASQIQIVADMSEITSVGTYPVPVKVFLNASGDVGVIGEYGIVVNVRK